MARGCVRVCCAAAQVHYGPASLSALSRLPAYFVFRQAPLDTLAVVRDLVQHAHQLTQEAASSPTEGASPKGECRPRPCAILVLLDQPYAHAAAALKQQLRQLQRPEPPDETSGMQERRESNESILFASAAVPIVVAETHAGRLDPTEPPHRPSVSHNLADPSGSVPHTGNCCSSGVQARSPGSAGLSSNRAGFPSNSGSAPDQRPSEQGTSCSEEASGGLPHNQHAADAKSATDISSRNGHAAGSASEADNACCGGGRSARGGSTSGVCSGSGRGNAVRAAGLSWELPGGAALEDAAPVWVGDAAAPGLHLLQLAHSQARWSVVDPATLQWQHGVSAQLRRQLQRRYYLVTPPLSLFRPPRMMPVPVSSSPRAACVMTTSCSGTFCPGVLLLVASTPVGWKSSVSPRFPW